MHWADNVFPILSSRKQLMVGGSQSKLGGDLSRYHIRFLNSRQIQNAPRACFYPAMKSVWLSGFGVMLCLVCANGN